ncbi:hypothetical protein BU17DRAFT_97743 [Hysterangium stoloniferum]|nr:hypothetical protein BU17DRAFT_97743 [Hysterangium stoloniferum]
MSSPHNVNNISQPDSQVIDQIDDDRLTDHVVQDFRPTMRIGITEEESDDPRSKAQYHGESGLEESKGRIVAHTSRSLFAVSTRQKTVECLPNELLGNILARCIPSLDELSLDQRKTNMVRDGLLLVCKRWRAVGQNTPRVWTTMVFNRTLLHDARNVKDWLSWSGACPVTIFVKATHRRPNDLINVLLGEIHRHFSHVRHLIVHDLNNEEYDILFPFATPTHAPMLESCWLRSVFIEVAQDYQIRMGQINSPCLSSIGISGPYCFIPRVLPLAPGRHTALTSLNIRGWNRPGNITDILPVLRCCPALLDLSIIAGIEVTPFTPRHIMPVELPALCVFSFCYVSLNPDDPECFLESIQAPALKDLRFALSATEDYEGWIDPFYTLMAPFSASLSKVTFTGDMDEDEIMDILRDLYRINELTLVGLKCADAIYEGLCPPPDTETIHWLCPHLRTLTIIEVGIKADWIVQLLFKRMLPVNSIARDGDGLLTRVCIKRPRIEASNAEVALELASLSQTHGDVEFSLP